MSRENKANRPKLTRADRQEVNAAILRARGKNKKEKSAQDTIPYQRMYPNGICRVTDKLWIGYTK